MTKKTIKGTIGEHKAIIQLMEDGYHVAKAVDPHCPFDLVAVGEEGDVKLIVFFVISSSLSLDCLFLQTLYLNLFLKFVL